ncbi:MAG: alpha/beta hydrolase, partial [Planctomycetaceae bacterium]
MDWLGWIIAILAAVLLVDLAGRALSVSLILPIFERKVLVGALPASPDPHAPTVAFPATDGLTLRGSLYQPPGDHPPRGLVLFCPGLGSSHWSAMTHCRALVEAGFVIFAFDVRNQGESDPMPGYDVMHWVTEYEVRDVLAAIQYAGERDDLRNLPLGLFGISRGGSAAVAAAARCETVQAVAAEGVFSTESLMTHYTVRWASLYVPEWVLRVSPMWHLRQTLGLTRWISQLRRRVRYSRLERWLPNLRGRRVLLITGQNDTYVPPDISRSLCRLVGDESCTMWVVPGARHNQARQADPEGYDERLVALFETMERSARPVGPAAKR